MVLIVFFSSRISPFTSTVIFFDKSPVATAVVTSAMLRTWPVRFPAIELTLSVRSRHVPSTPRTSACPPSFPSVPTSRATRLLRPVPVQLIHHRIDGVLQLENFALHIDGDLLRQIAARHRLRHVGNIPHLAGQVRGHEIHAVRKVLPSAGHVADVSLS